MPELKKANIWIGLTILLTLTLAYMFFQHQRTNRTLRQTTQEAADQSTANLCYLTSFNKFDKAISQKISDEEAKKIDEKLGSDSWPANNPDRWRPAEFFGRVFLHLGPKAEEDAYRLISDWGACQKALIDSWDAQSQPQ